MQIQAQTFVHDKAGAQSKKGIITPTIKPTDTTSLACE